MSIKDNTDKLDQLIKSLEELEKKKPESEEKPTNAEYRMKRLSDAGKCTRCPPHDGENPKTVQRSWKEHRDSQYKIKKQDKEGHGHDRDGEPMDATNKIEILSKPPTDGKCGKLPEKVKKSDDMDKAEKLYHIHQDGYRITDEPKPMKEIIAQHGPVNKLEAAGFRLHPHDEKETKSMKKTFEEIFGQGEDLLTKAEKDELFPEPILAPDAPKAVEYKAPKESIASSISYLLKELSEIRGLTYDVNNKTPEAKAALEYHFEVKKKDLKELIAKFKEAKPMKKSMDMYTLNKAVIKPKNPTPASAFMSDYKKPGLSPTTQDESTAHTISYDKKGKPTAKPPAVPAATPEAKPETVKPEVSKPKAIETHARMQQAKIKSGKSSFNAPSALDVIREKQKMKKSEVYSSITTESLTKSMRAQHSDEQITEMLKAAYDLGKIHHNVFLEWQNHKTVNPSVIGLVEE